MCCASLFTPFELLTVTLERTPAQTHTSPEECWAVIRCLLTKWLSPLCVGDEGEGGGGALSVTICFCTLVTQVISQSLRLIAANSSEPRQPSPQASHHLISSPHSYHPLSSPLPHPPSAAPSEPTLTSSIHSWIISICIPTGPGIP